MGASRTSRVPSAFAALGLIAAMLQACAPLYAGPLGIGIGAFAAESTPNTDRVSGLGLALTPGRLTLGWIDASRTHHNRPAPLAPGGSAVGE